MDGWVARYNTLIADLESKGVNPVEAAMIDLLPWRRSEIAAAGAIETAEQLISTIDELLNT